MVKLKCMINYYLNLLVLKNIQLYDIHYLRFSIEYRIEKCPYPILNFYDLRTTSIRNLGFNSRLGFSIHQLRILLFYSISLCIFHLLEDERADNFSYVVLAISPGRKNLNKIRINTDSRYCDSRLGTDYNTMSLTYISRFEFCG